MRPTCALLCAFLCFALLQAGCASRQQASETAATGDQPAAPAPPNGSEADEGESLAPVPPGSDARAYFKHGMESYRRNLDQQAVESFKEAVRLDPEFAEAHYRLGLAYSVTGQRDEAEEAFKEAVKAYEKVVKREPKDAEAHYFLGLALGRVGEYDKAVKALKEAARNAPDDDDKHYELGLAHMKIAEYKEAISAFNKALEINPDNFPASEALERAKPGLERREAFLKQQEKLKKEQEQKARGRRNENEDDGNANVNGRPAPPSNAAPKPPGGARGMP